ncbi:hypothetical protein BH18GEM1_BH18GEM1_03650 [soil metagenome]
MNHWRNRFRGLALVAVVAMTSPLTVNGSIEIVRG